MNGSSVGITIAAATPPAAAARVPLLKSSLCVRPGITKVHVGVDETGRAAGLALITLRAAGSSPLVTIVVTSSFGDRDGRLVTCIFVENVCAFR